MHDDHWKQNNEYSLDYLKFLKLLLLGGELVLRGLDGLYAVCVLGHGHEAAERVPHGLEPIVAVDTEQVGAGH